MTKYKIVEIPDERLRQISKPVDVTEEGLDELLEDMLSLMYETHGVGLAAPQIGLLKRLVVIDISKEKNAPIYLINPEIIWKSEEKQNEHEGCLSIPNQYASVERHLAVTVRYTDKNRKQQELSAEGFLAIALQHEIDHLNGVLFIDYLSPLKRKMLLKRLEKRRKLEKCE